MKGRITQLSAIAASISQRLWIYWAILFVYLSPYFLGPNWVRILIHDNLDGLVPSTKFLANLSGWFASNATSIPGFLHELPRVTLGSEFSVILWMYAALPPYSAYALNMIAMHVCAFWGAYLLLKHYLLPHASMPYQGLLALFFALLPFWPSGGLSIAGQAMTLYAFFNLLHNKHVKMSLIWMCFYPFYCHFFWAGIFFFGLHGLIFIWHFYQHKEIPKTALIGLIAMGGLHVLVEYRLFLGMFGGDFRFHREAFNINKLDTFAEVVGLFVKHLREGYYQSLSLHVGPMLLLAALGLIPIRRTWNADQRKILALLVLLLVCSAIYASYNSFLFKPIKEAISLVNAFNLGRAYTLYPVLWLIIVGFAIRTVQKQHVWLKRLALLALGFQLLWGFSSSYEFKWTLLEPGKNAIKRALNKGTPSEIPPSFNAFFCVDNFAVFNSMLTEDPSEFYTASVGFHPSVSLYNGLQTIDGYIVLYPLSYKETFRQVIAGELEKNEEIRSYFDNWGSRCYVFSAEIGKQYYRHGLNHIERLDVSAEALRQLNTKYLLSALPIQELPEGIAFVRKIDQARQFHPLYIYQIESNQIVKP